MKRINMKSALIGASVGVAFCTAAFAADVTVSVGEPGYYGRVDVSDAAKPTLVSPRPVVVEREHVVEEPIYVYVPSDQQRDWARYCGKYSACDRPVYFVEERWYNDVYVPRYRSEHAARHEERRELHESARDAKEDAREAKHDAKEAKHEAREAKRDYKDARREERDHS
jgi:hypothetical protein